MSHLRVFSQGSIVVLAAGKASTLCVWTCAIDCLAGATSPTMRDAAPSTEPVSVNRLAGEGVFHAQVLGAHANAITDVAVVKGVDDDVHVLSSCMGGVLQSWKLSALQGATPSAASSCVTRLVSAPQQPILGAVVLPATRTLLYVTIGTSEGDTCFTAPRQATFRWVSRLTAVCVLLCVPRMPRWHSVCCCMCVNGSSGLWLALFSQHTRVAHGDGWWVLHVHTHQGYHSAARCPDRPGGCLNLGHYAGLLGRRGSPRDEREGGARRCV